ncbi:MAG: CDP-alcohol phosphatidyltransferase family protein [Pirellulaceae bacterium]|nr:CDP-alcohol phosphatidyltransferase family protein [Pirellulaceae bacterium]
MDWTVRLRDANQLGQYLRDGIIDRRHVFDGMGNMSDETSNRRPLKTRGWGIFQRFAAWLATTPVTPNMISASSVLFGVAAGVTLAATSVVDDDLARRILWGLSGVFIQCRLIANLLDGMVAIEGGKASAVGDLYNEVPDRISDSAIFIGAGFSLGGRIDLGLLAALVAVFVAYVRAMGASVGVGQVFAGPMAKPQRMALMTGVCLVCLVFPSSRWTIGDWPAIGFSGAALIAVIAGGVATSVRRLRLIGALMRERATEKVPGDV